MLRSSEIKPLFDRFVLMNKFFFFGLLRVERAFVVHGDFVEFQVLSYESFYCGWSMRVSTKRFYESLY